MSSWKCSESKDSIHCIIFDPLGRTGQDVRPVGMSCTESAG